MLGMSEHRRNIKERDLPGPQMVVRHWDGWDFGFYLGFGTEVLGI